MSKLDVICLFEYSGFSAYDWALNGHNVYCYDIKHIGVTEEKVGFGSIIKSNWDAKNDQQTTRIYNKHLNKSCILLSYPPCTDLAVSGAAWFAKKLEANPNYREEAMYMVYIGGNLANALNIPYCIENPVSVISSQWRKPNYIFNPYEYGGYLPENDIHPLYPEYIESRDAYPKKTCYWTSDSFIMPEKKPVDYEKGYSKQHRLLGGKSEKTKTIRNASPRGIAKAIYLANKGY